MEISNSKLELIQRCIDQEATPEELQLLEKQLLEDSELRQLYYDYLLVDSSLPNIPLNLKTSVKTPQLKKRRIFTNIWNQRSINVAAGIIVGFFCASLTFGIVQYQTSHPSGEESLTPIVAEHFENASTGWSGNLMQGELVEEKDGLVSPLNDSLIIQSTQGNATFCASKLFAMPEAKKSRRGQRKKIDAEVTFLVPEEFNAKRYTLHLAALENKKEDISIDLLNDRWSEIASQSSTSMISGYSVDPAQAGWKKLTARLTIPSEAQSLVMRLSVTTYGSQHEPQLHFFDDLYADLVITNEMGRRKERDLLHL